MMRVTHTLKGAAGTVGLDEMVDLAHRLESAFAAVGRRARDVERRTADLVVEVTDGLRGYLDELVAEPGGGVADRRSAAGSDRADRRRRAGSPERPSARPLEPGDPGDSLSMPTIVVTQGDGDSEPDARSPTCRRRVR